VEKNAVVEGSMVKSGEGNRLVEREGKYAYGLV